MHFDIATAHGAGMRVADASIDLSGLDGPDRILRCAC